MTRRTKMWACAVVMTSSAVVLGARVESQRGAAQPASSAAWLKRPPADEIRKNIDRAGMTKAAIGGLMDYWFEHSVEPNGFIQENLDRQWKPWGTQREASINGQGRQLYSMAVAYEMAPSPEYKAALTRGMDFLMKMRDPEFGGYYDRVGPNHEIINDTKTGFSSFAIFSLAEAGRVTGERRYIDAAMVFFREMRDKMREGPFIGTGNYRRDFMLRAPATMFGGRGGAPGTPGAPAAAATPPAPPGGPPAGAAARRYRINLHAFEALLSLYHATNSEEVWYEIQQELNAIERLYDYTIGYLPESYDEEWKPVGNPSGNPGHLFEWASLLSRAVELGADPKFVQLGSRSLDLGLKSYSEEIGGLGAVGQDGKPARMLWWPQCEVVKATANYAILHGRSELWRYHHKTLEFLKREYFDPTDGGWFPDYVHGQPRAERGERAFYKGSVDGPEWGAYHQMSMFHDIWRITDPAYQPGPAAASRTPAATRGKE
jgi:cellobiose epimerase